MKKYTSDEFVATKYGIYKAAQDIITSLPATIIGNGSNVSPWTIKGNMTVSAACGDKTANLFDYKSVYASYININGDIATMANNITAWNSVSQEWVGKTITISCYVKSIDASYIRVQGQVDGAYITGNAINSGQTGYTEITITPVSTSDRWRITYGSETVNVVINQVMVEESSTRTAYQPYGYKIPILCGETTNTIYISEPLRKALDGSGLYDTIESSGVLTRRVDSSGDALATPTTEQIAVPTISTTAGAQTFTIDTTLKPSEVDLTYTGWHMYDDKKYSGGWG